MSVSNRSRDRVEERLARLEEGYSSFPVNQTTLSVPSGAYERARDRSTEGLVDVYVQVYNDDNDVLLLRDEDAWTVPRAEPRAGEELEAGARRRVREETGVDCTIEDLHRATILGIRNEDDDDSEPLYRLITVFVAHHHEGQTATPAVEWHSDLPENAIPAY
jgi:ADP-ribose pyrophosphatase YjhB (NUDIX family)